MASSDSTPSKVRSKHKRNRSQITREVNNEHQQPQVVVVEDEEAQTPLLKKPKANTTWANLDLILSLKNNDLQHKKKVELAFDFVTSDAANININGYRYAQQPVSVSRLASFLSEWIQPLLVPPRRKSSGLDGDPSLDYRCWVILIFCLKKNSSFAVSLNLLNSVAQVLKCSDDSPSPDGKRLLESLVECFELILSSNPRAFYNAGMELWLPCVIEICGVVRRVSGDGGGGLSTGDLLSRLSILLLEHFVNFLRFHKDPANVFSKFVDGIVEPLLELLVLLQLRSKDDDSCGNIGKLLKLVEDVLSNGLFHPAHIGGFFSLGSLDTNQNTWAPKGHMKFFKKLGNLISEKKAMALWGFGSLFRLFVLSAKSPKGASLVSRNTRALGKINESSDERQETSKPLFEVFVQFVHPLFIVCKRYSEKELSEFGEDWLLEAHGMLKSMNETVLGFIQEKVYVRTQDTSEGAHFKFLEDVYGAIILLAGKIYQFWLSTVHTTEDKVKKMLNMVAREIIAAIGYFVEIEYKVVDNDLVKLWLMMFSFLNVDVSIDETKSSLLLTSEILNLGCKMVNIYGELRQVSNPLFALCKALRVFRNVEAADTVDCSMFVSSSVLSSHIHIKSLRILLCSQHLRVTISSAIKAIPEGQASGFIQHLETDITDSLEWIKNAYLGPDSKNLTGKDSLNISMSYLDMQSEILGRHLSEVYTTVLDSLSVSATNSIPVGNSVKNLMGKAGQSLVNLVHGQTGSIDEFIFSVTGRRFCDFEKSECDGGVLTIPLNVTWFFVFFFRIYISCRSLYRQLVSLLPPDSSTKAAKLMGNLFTVARESDWKEKPDLMDEGYFSWIVKPSISLLDVIKLLADLCSSSSAGCPSLRYVLHIMILQRLNDSNRLVSALKFLLGRHITKSSEQWKTVKRIIKVSSRESAELTNYMTECPKLLDSTRLYRSIQNDEIAAVYDDSWDLAICSLNESSLHTAIWRLLCRNVDVWCNHAAKKHIWKFLSCLFLYASQFGKSFGDVGMQSTKGILCEKVAMCHISMDFFTDIVSCEQPILHRYFASRFCHIAKKLMSPILSQANIDLRSEPVWSEFLRIMGKGSLPAIDNMTVSDHYSLQESDLVISNAQCLGVNDRRFCSFSFELRTCERLLNLLCKISKAHVDAKSLLFYARCVLNLERLAVSNLQNYHGDSFVQNPLDFLQLFISCRRVIKYLLVASFEDNLGADSLSLSSVFGSSESILWLLKSVSEIVGLGHAIYEEKYSKQVQDGIFSLIEHTSYIFSVISERQMHDLRIFLLNDEGFHKEQHLNNNSSKQRAAVKADIHVSSSESHGAEKIMDTLEEQAKNLLDTFEGIFHEIKLESHIRALGCNKLSAELSCFQGFLWGLISFLDSVDSSIGNLHFFQFVAARFSILCKCITAFEDLVKLCLNLLIVDDKNEGLHDKLFDKLTDSERKLSCTEVEHGSSKHLWKNNQARKEDNSACQHNNGRNPSGFDYTQNYNIKKKRFPTVDAVRISNGFDAVQRSDFFKQNNSRGSLLQSLLKGKGPQIAFSLRQLFTTSAAMLKLNRVLFSRSPGSEVHYSTLAATSIGILLGTSQLLMREIAEMVGRLDSFLFALLDGILTFLEVASEFKLSEDAYAQLIDTYLRVMGKCISLQGKSASLSSHETGSNTKMLQSQYESSGNSDELHDHVSFSLNAFKARLRISFVKLIRRPEIVYLEIAINSLERALVGVQQGCNMLSEINAGSVDGGEVSPTVAAGIDCIDLVLESVSGQDYVKGKIANTLGSLFNIILHLQNPSIFCLEKHMNSEIGVKADTGSVILMCVEVLIKIAGNSSFHMDTSHVSQCLHAPWTIFKCFHQLSGYYCRASLCFNDKKTEPAADAHQNIVDHQFFVELYASCCRLLCTALKHRKSTAEPCIAVLEESVTVLLNCLEMVDVDLVGLQSFALKVEEAVKCASFFRRIYEEMKNQKDVFGEYSFYFLSNYICTYAGCGPLKLGFKREIDEALRPGVHSLIDVCSEADLQLLHTSLGEGPCRSTLKTLLHDYKVNFQYEGKI